MTEKAIIKQLKMGEDIIKNKLTDSQEIERLLQEEVLIKVLYQKMSKEYWKIVKPILNNKQFISLRSHFHHDDISTYTHSLIVSLEAYSMAKIYNLDYKSAAIGGLLHDFYCYDWHKYYEKEKGFKNKHFFVHGNKALENAKRVFPKLMNKRIENIISSHMFGARLLIGGIFSSKYFPRYKESWLVIKADISASLSIISSPAKIAKNTGLDTAFAKIVCQIKNNF